MNDAPIHYAASGDIHVAYTVVGDGPSDLLWVGGMPGNLDSHLPDLVTRSYDHLARFSRLILFDQRGAGLSDPVPPGATPTIEERVDDVRAVLDAAGSARATILGTHSGGQTALVFAATHPERVVGLILYGAFARFFRAPDYPAGLPEEASQQFLKFATWGSGASLATYIPSRAGDPELLRDWGRLERMAASPATIRSVARMYTGTDVRDVLPTIQVPTLVLHRQADPAFRVGHGRYLAEHIAGCRYVELAGSDLYPVTDEDRDLVWGEVEEFVTGNRTGTVSDRTLATVMFTDIVNSTATATALGDRGWRQLLDRHDEAVGRQVSRHRGELIKHTGDGFVAIFDGPARAVVCACAIRDAVRALGIEVRAGLHTGEIERRAQDVSGVGVHIASRVLDLAQAGEILVSSTVKDLVTGSGILFADRGNHRLKGVDDEWRILQVEV